MAPHTIASGPAVPNKRPKMPCWAACKAADGAAANRPAVKPPPSGRRIGQPSEHLGHGHPWHGIAESETDGGLRYRIEGYAAGRSCVIWSEHATLRTTPRPRCLVVDHRRVIFEPSS